MIIFNVFMIICFSLSTVLAVVEENYSAALGWTCALIWCTIATVGLL